MTTTCLINNFNYAQFIGEALDSALAQTVPFDEIIVVDDGSTDGSVELLASRYARHPEVQIVAKDNQGQLSHFNEGFARAMGEIVFFLDADNVYEPHYVEAALDVYRRDRHCDFVFCGHRLFGQQESLQLKFAEDRDLGYSVILTACLRDWIGTPTSCLSMRRAILERILPLPFPENWRTRAGDCLVFGASLAGARKYYVARPLVRYRVHERNQFFGRASDKFPAHRHRLSINTLFEYLQHKLCYDVARLAEFHHREFCTIAQPTFRQLIQYSRISMASPASLMRRLACIAEMIGHFMRAVTWPAQSAPHGASTSTEHDSSPRLRAFVPADSTAGPAMSQPQEQQRRAA
jgi:glycosyltransferase involved in cell wall biosynthesis